jgi:CheY-like chemotaxis protein
VKTSGEFTAVPKDDRDILEVLKAELDFIEKGGYGRSVRTPWKPTSIFQDSLTCLNFGDPLHSRPCEECLLMEFVPPAGRLEEIPCHRIPLTPKGETVASLDLRGDQEDLEEATKTWLRTQIRQIEEARAQFTAAQMRGWQKALPSAPDRKRVLVVDDDESTLIAVQAAMEDAGYDTTTAWSGQEALSLLRQCEFNFILLDDYLPGVSTEEVLRQLQRMPGKAPVVIMQAAGLPYELAARYTRPGACNFIRKREPREIVELAQAYVARSVTAA